MLASWTNGNGQPRYGRTMQDYHQSCSYGKVRRSEERGVRVHTGMGGVGGTARAPLSASAHRKGGQRGHIDLPAPPCMFPLPIFFFADCRRPPSRRRTTWWSERSRCHAPEPGAWGLGRQVHTYSHPHLGSLWQGLDAVVNPPPHIWDEDSLDVHIAPQAGQCGSAELYGWMEAAMAQAIACKGCVWERGNTHAREMGRVHNPISIFPRSHPRPFSNSSAPIIITHAVTPYPPPPRSGEGRSLAFRHTWQPSHHGAPDTAGLQLGRSGFCGLRLTLHYVHSRWGGLQLGRAGFCGLRLTLHYVHSRWGDRNWAGLGSGMPSPTPCTSLSPTALSPNAFPPSLIFSCADSYALSLDTLFHELGHNAGLLHSTTAGNEYGDCSCAMWVKREGSGEEGGPGRGCNDSLRCFRTETCPLWAPPPPHACVCRGGCHASPPPPLRLRLHRGGCDSLRCRASYPPLMLAGAAATLSAATMPLSPGG